LTYAIFTQPNSIASTSSLTTSSTIAPSPSGKNQPDDRARPSSICGLLKRHAPSPSFDDDGFPPRQRRANQHSPTPSKMILRMRLPPRCARPYGPKTLLLRQRQRPTPTLLRPAVTVNIVRTKRLVLLFLPPNPLMKPWKIAKRSQTQRALKKASLDDGQVSSKDTPVDQYSSPA
jgi:hypothetical protein